MARKLLPLKILLVVLTVLMSFSIVSAKTAAYAPHSGTCSDGCICASASEFYKYSPTGKAGATELCGGGPPSQGCGEVDPYDNVRLCWMPIQYCGDDNCFGNETATSCPADCKSAAPTTNVTNITKPTKPTGAIGASQCGDCTPTAWGNCTTSSTFAQSGTQSGTCKDLCENTVTKAKSCAMPATLLNQQIAGVDTPVFIAILIGILVVAGVVASMRKKPKKSTEERVPQFKKLKKK